MGREHLFEQTSKMLSDQKAVAAMTVRREFDEFVLKACVCRGVEFKPGHYLSNLQARTD